MTDRIDHAGGYLRATGTIHEDEWFAVVKSLKGGELAAEGFVVEHDGQ